MVQRLRKNWSHSIDEVIRSRHYNWLGYGLGGEPVGEAMSTLLADVMHICKRHGIPWDEIVKNAREQFELEEREHGREQYEPSDPDDAQWQSKN